MIKYLKRRIKLLLYFMIFFINILAVEREIPHSIVTENPKKDVTTIETLKKYKDKAELNITVTKLKTEEIPVEVDKNRKKLLLTLKGIEGKNIYPVENIEDIPNPNTSLGRRNINRMRVNNNLRTTRYDITTGEKRTKLEIDYKELPKNTYLAVTDKNFNLEKIYRANYRDYSAPRGNSVSVKIWLFGEEMGSLTNLILNPSNKTTGNFEFRNNGEYSYPESATEYQGLYSVFDMQGQPELFDFEDSDYIELQNIGGTGSTSISNIQNKKGSFYKYRNEYAECDIPGYNLKARVWSDTPKLEFTLRKSGTTDGYVKFKILHKASDGTIRQEITVEMFINNKKFIEYFPKLYAEATPKYFGSVGYGIAVSNTEKINVINFITDSLSVMKYDFCDVTQIWAEDSDRIKIHEDSELNITETITGLNNISNKKISGYITNFQTSLPSEWINPTYSTTQYFNFPKYYFEYGNQKRRIDFSVSFGVTNNFQKFIEVIEGVINGFPFISSSSVSDKYLISNQKNGQDIITYFNGIATKFMVAKRRNKPFYYKIDGSIVNVDITNPPKVSNVKFRTQYVETGPTGFDYYYLYVDKLKLKKSDREIKLVGVDGIYEYENRIVIPKFSVGSLIDNSISSINKNIIKYVDVSDKFLDSSKDYFINLGTVYFKSYDDIGILKSNASKSPEVKLPSTAYLEDTNGNKISVSLSFQRSNIETALEMRNYYTSIKAGGNGSTIYLILSKDEYHKLLRNGGGKTYTLKGGNIKININLDTCPFGEGGGDGVLNSTLISEIKIITNKVEPSISKITFKENTPLLKSEFFSILNQDITYLNPNKDGYNYNQTIDLSGEIAQYNYTTRKHNYEILDNDGRIIKGFITSNGSGGYWENLDIGDGNKVTISQGKDTKTYMALNKWNYRASSGEILIKHYIESYPETNQYFKFNFELPDFDPYTYYDENTDTIGKLASVSINLSNGNSVNGKKQVKLGKVRTKNYDIEITKDENDSQGLRIENQSLEVDILEEGTLTPTSYKAKIIMKTSGGEISSIAGKSQEADIYVEVPDNLPSNKNYVIQSSHKEGNIFDDDNYLLRIGRTGFFKELIKEIKIVSQQIEGQATINVTSDYTLGEKIIFKTASNPFNEGLSLENSVTGISLEEVTGHGMLKIQSGDKAQIQIASSRTNRETDFYSDDNSFVEVTFPNGNKMKIGFDKNENNKLKLSFTKIILGSSKESSFRLVIKGADDTIKATYKFKVKFPESFLRIDKVENMNFGQAIVGLNGYKAKGIVFISTAKSISSTNLNIVLDTKEVSLIKENSASLPELKAKIEDEKLEEITESTLENNYKYMLDGELDIPKDTNLGIYKGTVQVTVSIRE